MTPAFLWRYWFRPPSPPSAAPPLNLSYTAPGKENPLKKTPSAFSLSIPQMIFSFLKFYLFLIGASLLFNARLVSAVRRKSALCIRISPPSGASFPTPPLPNPNLPRNPFVLPPLSSFPVSRKRNTFWKLSFALDFTSSDFLWGLVLSVKTLLAGISFSSSFPPALRRCKVSEGPRGAVKAIPVFASLPSFPHHVPQKRYPYLLFLPQPFY